MTSARKGRGAGAASNCVETASRSQPTQLADACMLASGKTSNSRLMFTRNTKHSRKSPRSRRRVFRVEEAYTDSVVKHKFRSGTTLHPQKDKGHQEGASGRGGQAQPQG